MSSSATMPTGGIANWLNDVADIDAADFVGNVARPGLRRLWQLNR